MSYLGVWEVLNRDLKKVFHAAKPALSFYSSYCGKLYEKGDDGVVYEWLLKSSFRPGFLWFKIPSDTGMELVICPECRDFVESQELGG